MPRHAERGAVHQPDTGAIHQIQHEVLVVGDDASIRAPRPDELGAGRKHIEGSLRLVTDNSIDGIEAIDNHVAPLFESGDVAGNEVLRAGERLESSSLADRRRVCRRVGLYGRHRLDQRTRSGAVADAPAGHAVRFRHPVHRQRAVIKLRLDLGGGDEFEVAIGEMLVNVVGEHPDVRVTHEDIGQRLEFRPRIGSAGRIGRRIEDHPARPGRDRRLEVGGCELEAPLRRARHDHGRSFGKQHDFRIGNPIRSRDDDLISRTDACHERVIDDLLPPGADDDLVTLITQAVLAPEFAGDRVFQRGRSIHGRVFGLTARDRGGRRRLDVVRGVEIGLAGNEAENIPAGSHESRHPGGQRNRRRGLHTREALGNLEHVHLQKRG